MFFGIVPGAHEKLATAMAQVAHGTDKLVVMTWFPLPRQDIWMSLARASVPVFPEPARGIRAIGKMAQYVETRERILSRHTGSTVKTGVESEIEKILDQAKNRKHKALSEVEAKSLLKALGLAVPRGGLARSAKEARFLVNSIGGPVALKTSSPDLLHKTQAGGIRFGLPSPDEMKLPSSQNPYTL